MELGSIAFQSESVAASDHVRRGGLHPQQLGYLSVAIDVSLFAASGLVAAAWLDAAPEGLYRLMQVLASALLLALFLGCCRIAKAHDPLALTRGSAWTHALKAIACFGLPPLAVLLLCLPFIASADPMVGRFVAWLVALAVVAVTFGAVSRLLFRLVLAVAPGRILVPQRIAVVGSGESAHRLIRWVAATAPRLVQVIGVFDDRDSKRTSGSDVAGQIRGKTADLIALYKRAAFDRIVIALPHSAEDRLLDLLRRLRQLPVDIVLAPDLMGFRARDQEQAELAGLKLYSLAQRPIREPQRLLKGAIDRTLAALAVLFLSPLLLVVSLAIKLDSDGPILFRQQRQGLGDTLFDVFKFRTMRDDLRDAVGVQQTRREDPRVTRLGSWLRRTSIDELPQLLNVLRGEMSLVGPRPHTPHMLIGDKRIFDLVDEYSFRHRVKPGITGLAQVSGYRGAIDTPEHLRARIHHDLYYIDHWSLWLDLTILCRTAAICVSGVNAY